MIKEVKQKKPIRAIDAIVLERAQLGWCCEVYFSVTTANQFTEERHSVKSGSAWLFIAPIKTVILALKARKKMAAKPGERAAIGWN